jgi:Holliday junction resolvase RusA-like endonuclease
MTTLAFSVLGEARPGGSKRAFVVKGRAVVTDDAGKSGKTWRRDVQLAANAALEQAGGFELLAGPLVVRMTFYRRRPKAHYGARGALLPSAPAYPTVKPDALKLARAIEDALTGLIWRDDAQIVAGAQAKRYGEPERVEISVTELAT